MIKLLETNNIIKNKLKINVLTKSTFNKVIWFCKNFSKVYWNFMEFSKHFNKKKLLHFVNNKQIQTLNIKLFQEKQVKKELL